MRGGIIKIIGTEMKPSARIREEMDKQVPGSRIGGALGEIATILDEMRAEIDELKGGCNNYPS